MYNYAGNLKNTLDCISIVLLNYDIIKIDILKRVEKF